jgi:AcrR family transcriptional regulator
VGSPQPASFRERAQRYSAAQRRTIDAAVALFGDHGVGGTSIQMIADAVGVTKAAIYHQFKTKEAIVIAVTEVDMARLEVALEEAEGGGPEAREALLARVIDTVLEHRRAVSAVQNDPVLVRFLNSDEQSRALWSRLFTALLGEELDARGRVRAAVLSAALGSVGHPFVADLDNDTLRAGLIEATRPLITPG